MAYGIVNYGCYIPRLRLNGDEYSKAWNGVRAKAKERAVIDFDEDVLTMAVESSAEALDGVDPSLIDVLCIASTSFPYSYRFNSGTIVSSLGLKQEIVCGEHGQSTRAGTEALIMALSVVKAWDLSMGLVVAADSPSASMTDDAESGLGAASASLVLGRDQLLAEVEGYACFTTEHLSSTFRACGESHIKDLGLAEYLRESVDYVLKSAITKLLARLGRQPSDYRYIVFSEVDGALRSLLRMGFTRQQMEQVLLADRVGDTGACSPLLGLVAGLDLAEPGERILVVSYGFGSGSDVLSLIMTDHKKQRAPKLVPKIDDKAYMDYLTYLKIKRGLR